MEYKTVKGMSDIYFPEIGKWQFVEEQARRFFGSRLYEEIRTPIVEHTELFHRSIGEGTDIVSKEMYTFLDRGERSLTLRPEMTASVIRAVIEHNLLGEREPLKLWYCGPMFRAERPQAGRKRQFHQIGVEIIGNTLPFCDAELLRDIIAFLETLGLPRHAVTVKLNNVGCLECRPAFVNVLRDFFTAQKTALCADCGIKVEKNVLRILDCKNPSCKAIAATAPNVNDYVCASCAAHMHDVQEALALFGVPYVLDRTIVRGLDYYTATVFEITSSKLGAQDAIAAGGRYNNLMRELGGPAKGAVGFAAGIERLLMCLEDRQSTGQSMTLAQTVYVAYSDKAYMNVCKEIVARLEKAGVPTYSDIDERSLSSQLKRANKFGFTWALIINAGEAEQGVVTLKDLTSSERLQHSIALQTLEHDVKALVNRGGC